MDYLINILIVIKWPLVVIAGLIFLLLWILNKQFNEQDIEKKEFFERASFAVRTMIIGISLGIAWILSSSPITKPMTTNQRFVPEPVIEQVQEKAGDPLPSRLREPKKSDINEKIDIKDEVKEILNK